MSAEHDLQAAEAGGEEGRPQAGDRRRSSEQMKPTPMRERSARRMLPVTTAVPVEKKPDPRQDLCRPARWSAS
jgi:hypothetical protein